MEFSEFQKFVESHVEWFRGRLPETIESICEFETSLEAKLPESLKWLLITYGYWHGTAVSNLADSVRDTLDARQKCSLPKHFIVLEDWQDGGVLLIDTGKITSAGEPPLYWIGMEDLGHPLNLEGGTCYESYGHYVVDQLPYTQAFIEEQHIRYDPSQFPEGKKT
jgi:hypothetical protein